MNKQKLTGFIEKYSLGNTYRISTVELIRTATLTTNFRVCRQNVIR